MTLAPVFREGNKQLLVFAVWVFGIVLILLGACQHAGISRPGLGRWRWLFGVASGIAWVLLLHLTIFIGVVAISLISRLFLP